MDILEEIKKLDLPSGEYIVAGSGIMAVRNIRKSEDVDLLVTESLFDTLRGKGWEEKPWTKEGIVGKSWLKHGHCEAFVEINKMNILSKSFGVGDLMAEAAFVEGIPFFTLERLMEFKKAYGRKKDMDDITLIENYLKAQT